MCLVAGDRILAVLDVLLVVSIIWQNNCAFDVMM